MQQVVQEINEEYLSEIDYIKSSVPYDELEMSGARAVWPEVLSIYAVKTTTDPDNPQEVASITDEKIELLRDIFWSMNEIDYRTEEVIGTEIIESDDGNGNIVEETVEVTEVYLYITVSHKTADEMAIEYNFNDDQLEQLAALFNDENNSLWTAVLFGISTTDDQIVAVALSQIGNVGGQPYWSWYGFGSRVPWCACFVSWCANECGYIDTGVIPKFAGCVNGVNWFREEWSPYEYWETMLPEGLEAVHPRYAISKRNEWMVNESDMVICYIKHSWGGAAKYVEIASKLQKSVINISCQCRQ